MIENLLINMMNQKFILISGKCISKTFVDLYIQSTDFWHNKGVEVIEWQLYC
jgi:hypothetical protein